MCVEPLESRIAPAVVTSFDLATLDGTNGFKLVGIADLDTLGFSVGGGGDINGDGFADFIVGASNANESGNNRGAAYVVFGQASGFPADFALSALDGTNGFKLSGVADNDRAGGSVQAAGDVNGDGFDDLIVGANGANEGGDNRGAAYVIFGKAASFAPSFALSTLDGSNGFKLSGVADNDSAARAATGAGDVNGDGFADLIVGASSADEGGTNRGAAYVIFGKPDGFSATVPLSGLDGSNGFKLSGIADEDRTGFSVSSAGDIDGDGFDDMIIGAVYADEGGTNRGAAYVVFGRAGGFGASVPLSGLNGSNGFKLSGIADGDSTGAAVSAAGDINGDGIVDLVVGSSNADEGGSGRGATYVVFGSLSGFGANVPLSGLNGTNGFKLSGAADGDIAGNAVSAAGDVNGDGRDDLLIGGKFASEGGSLRGAAFVVFGASSFSASVPLASLDGTNGFKLPGLSDDDRTGNAVSAAGDVNGDGFGDFIVGAYAAEEGGLDRGKTYVVFGFGSADVTVAANGRSATFTDWDGDLVSIKTTLGTLDPAQFKLSAPNPLTGGANLIYADFTAATTGNTFIGANLSFTAKRGATGGDGLVNLGTLDARGVALGRVRVDGDMQQLDAAGAAGLKVHSLGQFADAEVQGAPLTSEIDGRLGALKVKTDVSRVTITAETIGAIKALNLDNVHLFAAGVTNPASAASALAIQSLTVTGSVRASQILAGYDASGAAVNADVQIGAVKVAGQWIASDLAAGVRAGVDGIFATGDANETLIPGGNAIVARIASISIGGAAFGTVDNRRDGFGFAAEQIGSLTIGKAKLPLVKGARNDTTPLLAGLTGDVRVREVA